MNRMCSDCDGEMEAGFIPDSAPYSERPAYWHRGRPEREVHFGLIKGQGIKRDAAQEIVLSAYRCTQCGLVKIYAES